MAAGHPGGLIEASFTPQLDFRIEDSGTLMHAAVPTIRFGLRIDSLDGPPIRSIALDVQLQIAARRRQYDSSAEERLVEIFGESSRWGTTLRTLPWTRVSLNVAPFEGSTVVDVAIPVTYDFEVTASKYLDSLEDGEVPLEFLFAGTFFYAGADGRLQTGRIGWDQEAEHQLPVRVWRETMDHYFPNAAWVRLNKDTFDRLYAYKASGALTSWEAAIDSLLPKEEKA